MDYDFKTLPVQSGKTAIVTGANAGLGFETTRMLAEKGVRVVMACRSPDKAEPARRAILQKVPAADLTFIQLDLASLASVQIFAALITQTTDKIDLLINNAGVMVPPFQLTEDGFELQFGANYLAHFLLTGLLLPLLEKAEQPRVVSLSSIAHQRGTINFADLQSRKSYSRMTAYAQSKLACLMFAFELHRRLQKTGSSILSVAAHPGVSDTELMRHVPALLATAMRATIGPWVSHKPSVAALPEVLAALHPGVQGGDYLGPTGFREMKGPTGKAKSTRRARDPEAARRLWAVSQELTGIRYLSAPA